jgi:hypothetical protein
MGEGKTPSPIIINQKLTGSAVRLNYQKRNGIPLKPLGKGKGIPKELETFLIK